MEGDEFRKLGRAHIIEGFVAYNVQYLDFYTELLIGNPQRILSSAGTLIYIHKDTSGYYVKRGGSKESGQEIVAVVQARDGGDLGQGIELEMEGKE